MPLSWNEIKSRAVAFSKEWENEISEDAEAKSFWDDFFNVFGISRRRVATFEQKVKKIDDKQGYIDLLWKGHILIEHKSKGKSLDKAYKQAKEYFPGLTEQEIPRYILVSDFEHFRLYDLESNDQHDFLLRNFVDHVHRFGFIAGYQRRTYKEQDPVNIEAAELMGVLHDKLKSMGYDGHALEVYLVRLLFLLFADDTNIFEKGIFFDFLDLNTKEDGSDLAAHLSHLFQILNTPIGKRLKNLDESLSTFPYVNGKLFEEHLPIAAFDSKMRKILLDCCALNWGKISPAIFGSLFQSVMDEKARRNLGAHYTSEGNILKLIKPLFMDELWAEFEASKQDKRKLQKLHERISKLRFLDPACGCGNFLIVAYRELRELEMEIIKHQLKGQTVTDISEYFTVDVDLFYGIEFEEFPAQIAQVAMWLIDHQMNMKASETFGEYYVRLPLSKSATIVRGNALRTDWQALFVQMSVEKEETSFDYILGNPPFVGHHYQNNIQKEDIQNIFANVKGAGVLDYVAAWYIKAVQYMKRFPETKTAFVSTSSISQGEQTGILWNELLNRYNVRIHFAHRSFRWGNEARSNAAVHVVIIGFAIFDVNTKKIYEYDDVIGEPHEAIVKNINAYLVGAKDIIITNKNEPICDVPRMIWGNKPTDGGNFLFSTMEERDAFIAKEPDSKKWIRPYISGEDFLYNNFRWCLWLENISPNELRNMKEVMKRVEAVKDFRLQSKAEATRKKALTPTLFAQIAQPKSNYLAVPEVSSEKRVYIPIGFMSPEVIASNTLQLIPNATLFHFGILTSKMHMTWMKYVCGRLESRYRYSNSIVYNNFPWPQSPTEKQLKAVEDAAQSVLEARLQFDGSCLADLYDPNTMPPILLKAHQNLDRLVDLCYRPQSFPSENKRMEFLFEQHENYMNGMFSKVAK